MLATCPALLALPLRKCDLNATLFAGTSLVLNDMGTYTYKPSIAGQKKF